MNIKEAKEEIKNTVRAYLRKDDAGNYRIAAVHQRPVLLIGPPGIGKTAIVKQVAREEGIGLVTYTMTHHTRQSAVGLPVLVKRQYRGEEYTITEYTMSEIISSVYECIEHSGCSEGILFIDEINCVSETLSPTMLQFLQNKTFGMHKVPDGWVIVAAGNPQAYNRSAREFDVATLDRVRRMDVTEDFEVWKEYSYANNMHPAVLSWLNMHPDRFYYVENSGEEKHFVTARGWEDLSVILRSYEEMGIGEYEPLIGEYIQEISIARDFAEYYQLYRKYQEDYPVLDLLGGHLEPERRKALTELAGKAGPDERLSLSSMILDGWNLHFKRYGELRDKVRNVKAALDQWKKSQEGFESWLEQREQALRIKKESGLTAGEALKMEELVQRILRNYLLNGRVERCPDTGKMTELFENFLRADENLLEEYAEQTGAALERGFCFAEECFGDGLELSLLCGDLMRNPDAVEFIKTYGCEKYFAYSDSLLLEQKRKEILQELEKLVEE